MAWSRAVALKRASSGADRILPTRPGVTILLYHRVGGATEDAVDLDVDVFDAQMRHLAEHHDVVSLDVAADLLAPPDADPWADASVQRHSSAGNTVVITFDDGTADFVEGAVPVMARYGLPATLFLATSFTDERRPFAWGSAPTTWSALREATSGGLITIGSHTHRHHLLHRTPPHGVADELDRSIDLICEHLGTRPAHFAYPKAVPGSPDAEIEVRRRFRTASLAGNRVNRPGRSDLHRLGRTPVQRRDTFDDFVRKAAGGHRLEGAVREFTASYRYRDAIE